MKRFLDSKDLKFETLSNFTHGSFIDKYTQNELYERIGSLCGSGPLGVGRRYRANALDDAIFQWIPNLIFYFYKIKVMTMCWGL